MPLKKTLLRTAYNFGGFAPFRWAYRSKILILTYHRFSREKDFHKVAGAEFLLHLEYLQKHNRIFSLSEVIDSSAKNNSLPPNATVITIDDGYRDVYEVAFPLLKDFGFPATLYAITDFLDEKCWLWTDLMRYVLLNTKSDDVKIEFKNASKIEAKLSDRFQKLELANRINSQLKQLPNKEKDAQIIEIADTLQVEIPPLPPPDYAPISWRQALEMEAGNLQIESHTVTHPILTNVNQTELDFELQTSKQRLEKALNKKIEHFCYPNGGFNEAVRKSVEKAGYKSAVTTAYGFNEKQANQFTLNRVDAPPAIEHFAQSASGFEDAKQRIRK